MMKLFSEQSMKTNGSHLKGLDLLSGNSLNLQGKRIPILSGEVQFFRLDPQVWEACLRQVKALGLPMVSTYLSWYRFSKGPGQFDLLGETDPRLNVPKFLELCKKVGLYVTMKPGPWICAEETNGGYPDWLINQPDLQVLNAQNQPVSGYNFPFQSPIPSYFHPDYQQHVQQWLEAVDKVIQPYCYPDGPILLVQLDNEPGFAFHDRIFESDYNAVIAEKGGLYSQWLEEKYDSLASLNECYGSSYTAFSEITPPRKLELSKFSEISSYMDWVEFKETLLANHVASIGKYHLQNGIDKVLFTINYNLHPQLAVPNNWHFLECASGMGGFDYYPNLPMDIDNFTDMVQAVNYSRAVNRVAWSPEIMCGIWSFAGSEHSSHHLPSSEYEYLYLTCLAYGLKGMNFYMLADRDNWVNSPINAQGELTETANAVLNTVKVIDTIPSFADLKVEQDVGVLYYRPYAREAFIAQENPMQVENIVLGKAYEYFKETYQHLLDKNINAGIYDPDLHPEKLPGYSLLFAPMNQIMDSQIQLKLLDYISRGGCLVCWPKIPTMGWDGSSAEVLKNAWDACSDIQETSAFSMVRIEKGFLIKWNDSHWDAEALQDLLRRFSKKSSFFVRDPRIKTTVQKSQSDWVYSVINTTAEAAKVELTFNDLQKASLADVLSSGQQLEIVNGKTTIEIPARSVRMFWEKRF